MWFLPGSVLALCLLPLVAVQQVSAAALTMELEASERACYFVDCDQAGEKIGTSKLTSTSLRPQLRPTPFR